MQRFQLIRDVDKTVIFEGMFKSMRHCVESALTGNCSLAGVDLSGADLTGISLDGADLCNARLSGCNFTGANLSEVHFDGVIASNADFTNACLCASMIRNADFRGGAFTGALIDGSMVDGCTFDDPSLFGLRLMDAVCGRNVYEHDGRPCPFTGAPVVIDGLSRRIVFLDNAVLIGGYLFGRDEVPECFPDWKAIDRAIAGRGD